MRKPPIDLVASLITLANNEHVTRGGMLKLQSDLDRYRTIIEATTPEVIVETGTRTGASARWFAALGVDVITVDIDNGLPEGDRATLYREDGSAAVIFLRGRNAADPKVAEEIRELVAERRCMVSLDSDHSAPHVAKEIELYGPMVTPGCYLVVEDGIFGYATPLLRAMHGLETMVGSPLGAIAEHLEGNPDWSWDLAIEGAHPTTHHPHGFWLRTAREEGD